jgi:hypothetical protein
MMEQQVYILIRTDFPAFGEQFDNQEAADKRMWELNENPFWQNKLEIRRIQFGAPSASPEGLREKWAFNIIAALKRQGYWQGTTEDHHDSECIVFQVLENMAAQSAAPSAQYERGRQDEKKEIRDALICDQATGAGDYSEAEEYADRIVGKAAKDITENTENKPRAGLLLDEVTASAPSRDLLREREGSRAEFEAWEQWPDRLRYEDPDAAWELRTFGAGWRARDAASAPPDPLLAELEKLVEKWRKMAVMSREEAGRIRRTVMEATEAEANCFVRAEVWDKNADELEQLLRQREGG